MVSGTGRRKGFREILTKKGLDVRSISREYLCAGLQGSAWVSTKISDQEDYMQTTKSASARTASSTVKVRMQREIQKRSRRMIMAHFEWEQKAVCMSRFAVSTTAPVIVEDTPLQFWLCFIEKTSCHWHARTKKSEMTQRFVCSASLTHKQRHFSGNMADGSGARALTVQSYACLYSLAILRCLLRCTF